MNTNEVIMIGDMPESGSAEAGVVTIQEDDENKLPRHAVRLDDGTVRLPFFTPATLKWKKVGSQDVTEETFTELVMRRLNGKDMTAITNAGKEKQAMTAIALSAQIPPFKFQHIFDTMDGADIQAAGAVVSHFLANGPRTGR